MNRRRSRTLLIAVALAAATALSGCTTVATAPVATAPTPTAPTPTTSAPPALKGSLNVYAAASLTLAFNELASEFEAEHPDVDVKAAVYDGSSVLATQILAGAPADVFASADEKNMQKVVDAGLVDAAPTDFASNTLRIVTPPDNPGGVKTLADLARPGLRVVVCAPEVPCGAASVALLGNAGVAVTPASQEQNVTAVLTKVESGEADAGLVYVTDAQAAGVAVSTIKPAGADAVVNTYPIAALKNAAGPEVARAFLAFVLGDRGQAVLKAAGFEAP